MDQDSQKIVEQSSPAPALNTITPVAINTASGRNGTVIAVVLSIILAIAGLIFGITGFIKANEALKILESYDFTEVEDGTEEAIENDEEEPENYIGLSYNNGEDFVDIYEGEINYYAYDSEGEVVSNKIEADTNELFEYLKDNDLDKLTDEEVGEDATWSVEYRTVDGDYFVTSGTEEVPDWVNELLNKLNVEENGYQSEKASL